jgi:hypothetical protein
VCQAPGKARTSGGGGEEQSVGRKERKKSRTTTEETVKTDGGCFAKLGANPVFRFVYLQRHGGPGGPRILAIFPRGCLCLIYRSRRLFLLTVSFRQLVAEAIREEEDQDEIIVSIFGLFLFYVNGGNGKIQIYRK